MEKINIYIDGNNLHRRATDLGFVINYKKFTGWLKQKYNANNVYLFLGFLCKLKEHYAELTAAGLSLVFKEVTYSNNSIKGNCDAEMVLKVVSDFYTKSFSTCLIITGDGDFGCLVEFLKNNKALSGVIGPDESRCSLLLKNKNVPITFLNAHYHKFSTSKMKRPPMQTYLHKGPFLKLFSIIYFKFYMSNFCASDRNRTCI